MRSHVCPVWIGYLIASPIRKLWQSPEKILSPFLRSGMTVLEVGPGIGYFTLRAARLVGPSGRVVAVDVQEGMLAALRKRATDAGLAHRVETRLCIPNSLGIADLAGSVDFVLLFAVVHEVPDVRGLFSQLADAAKAGCQVLFAEPRGHVPESAFEASMALAVDSGFRVVKRVTISGSHAAVLEK